MRNAKASDYWKALYKKVFPTQLNKINFDSVPGIGSGEIDFLGPVTAICGGNGVGKSTLIDAILATVRPDLIVKSPLSISRLDGASISSISTHEGNSVNKTVTLKSAETDAEDEDTDQEVTEIQIEMMDPSLDSGNLIHYFAGTDNLDELLDGISPIQSSEKQLKVLSYLVGKEYTEVKTFEILDFDEDHPTPYFEVKTAKGGYSTTNMGQGELAIFLMNWKFNNVRENSVLLLDEPETHLSPKSQTALMNVLAKTCTQRGIWAIVTTHSPTIVESVPLKHVQLIYRDGENLSTVQCPSESLLCSTLGMRSRIRGAFLFEDEAAILFAKALFQRLCPSLINAFEMVNATGESEIVSALNKLPKLGDWMTLIGIFDGDQRGEVEDATWPHVFLPGSSSPEIELKAASNLSADALAPLIQKDVPSVGAILASSQGLDHHEWFMHICQHLAVSSEQLMTALVEIWLREEANENAASTFISNLISTVGEY